MRATPWLRSPRVRPIRHCFTTARGRSTWLEPTGAGVDASRDMLQGLMGLADEPIAGGRHKVFGHPELAVIPQTSTVASHLPRAVGLAIALQRAHRLRVDCEWPRTRSWCARSETPPRTIPPQPARSIPPSLRPSVACPYRFSSSARTTASASRCRHRRVGSRRRTGPGQGWPTWRPTALIREQPGRRSCKR